MLAETTVVIRVLNDHTPDNPSYILFPMIKLLLVVMKREGFHQNQSLSVTIYQNHRFFFSVLSLDKKFAKKQMHLVHKNSLTTIAL